MANDKEIIIIINIENEFDYKRDKICYKDVLKLMSLKDDNNPNTKPLYTVLHNGVKLLKGECIDAYDRMEFTVGATKGS